MAPDGDVSVRKYDEGAELGVGRVDWGMEGVVVSFVAVDLVA